MILTTTPAIEGRTITEYKGVVFGEVISGGDVADSFEEDKLVDGTEVPFVRHCQLDFVLVLGGIVFDIPRAAKVGVGH